MTSLSSHVLQRLFAATVLAAAGHPGLANAATDWSVTFKSNCSGGLSSAGALSTPTCLDQTGISGTEVGATALSNFTSTTSNGAYLYGFGSSGVGVITGAESISSTGPHAADSYGRIDAIVLKFTSQVAFSDFKIGWNGSDNTSGSYNDSDIAVYAWQAPTTDTDGKPDSWSRNSSGWSMVGTPFLNVGASDGINANSLGQGIGSGTGAFASPVTYSSYWLISALGSGAGTDTNIDAFKLLSVSGVFKPSSDVPEPGSLTLLAVCAAGLLAARRKVVARR